MFSRVKYDLSVVSPTLPYVQYVWIDNVIVLMPSAGVVRNVRRATAQSLPIRGP